MILLALDTSAGPASVALAFDGRAFEAEIEGAAGQTATLPGAVHALLERAGCAVSKLQGVACGIGPGSFTSLRVGVAYAQGLALGLGCPALGVSSLAMLAQAAGPGQWVVAQDARMGEVYLGAYRVDAGSPPQALLAEQVGPAAVAPRLPPGPWGCAGNAWAEHGDALRTARGVAAGVTCATHRPHAREVLRIAQLRFARGEGGDALQLQPNYLRDRVALTLAEQRARTPSR